MAIKHFNSSELTLGSGKFMNSAYFRHSSPIYSIRSSVQNSSNVSTGDKFSNWDTKLVSRFSSSPDSHWWTICSRIFIDFHLTFDVVASDVVASDVVASDIVASDVGASDVVAFDDVASDFVASRSWCALSIRSLLHYLILVRERSWSPESRSKSKSVSSSSDSPSVNTFTSGGSIHIASIGAVLFSSSSYAICNASSNVSPLLKWKISSIQRIERLKT